MSEFGKILKQASTRVMPSSPYGVNLSTINPENYTSQLGPNISGTFEYLNFARADAQTDWESAANFMGRSVGKALLSVPETAGFILDIPSWFTNKGDYNNMLSSWARNGKDKLDEVLPEYSKGVEENNFNPFSRGWWWRNGDSVVESLGYFVPALGVGKLVGGILALGEEVSLAARIARGMNKFSSIATTAEKVAEAGGVISSSIASNYAEGMQMAASAYSETYKELLPRVGQEEAKKLASEAASKIVRANRVMLIPQLLESQIFFKSFDHIRRNKGIMKNWAMRNLPEVGKQMALEGGEELYQGIVEREAKRKALIDGGIIEDDNSSLYGRAMNYLTSSEGLTEGFLGAIGGGLFGVIGDLTNMKKTARDRKTALAAITQNKEAIKNILNKQGKLLDTMNEAVDMNNPVAVENAVREMFVNRAWLAAETGTFSQLEEYVNSIEHASQEEIEKNGWDRNTLGSKVSEFKALLSKVEDVYNKVHSLGSNLSAEYKVMMGNHLLTQIATSENMQSTFGKFEELINKHFLKREGRNNLGSVARADLYQAVITRNLAKATIEERKKAGKLNDEIESYLTSLIVDSEQDINDILKENELANSAINEVISDEVLNTEAYKLMSEYLKNEMSNRIAKRDYNFYSEKKNREAWEKQMEEASKEENKTPVQESVPVEETKKETKKEVKDETIRQKEIETQNKVNEKTQDLIEEGKIFKESLTNVFKEFERDNDLPNSKLVNNTGNAIEHPVDNSTTMKSIIMYKRKDGSTGFSLNMKGKTSKIDFDSEQKLLSHVKNLLEQEKQEREKAGKPVTQNKKVYAVPLTVDVLENLENGSTIQIESKTGDTIHFVKINDVIEFKGISYTNTGDYYELMPNSEPLNSEIKNLSEALNLPGIPEEYLDKGFVVVNKLVNETTQKSDGKIVDEKLPEVKESLDEAPTIDNQVASSMRVWSEKEVNPPLFSEVRNRENELPGLSLTLQTVDSKTATLKDNSYDVDYLYSSNSVEDTSLQLEADLMWKPTDAFDYLEAPVVLVSAKRKEDIDSPVAGRLAHLQVIKMFDGEYDFNQESTSSSYEYWTVRQIKSKLSQTDKSDTNEIQALNKALSKARARVKDNIALRKSLFGEGKVTAEQRKNTKPLPVNALSKTSGMIQTTSAYSPAIDVFEANDAFGLGIPHTLGVLHFTGLGWGGLNEETGLPNIEATSFGVSPIQANAQAGSVYLLSQSNPGGTYIPIKLLAQTLTSLSQENQNKVVDKLFSLIEEFKKAGEINDVKKAQDEIRRIQNEISKLYQSTFSTSKRGHGTVVLDTGVMSIGKDKFRLGKYIALRKQVNGRLEEYRFYFFAKFGDRYGYLKPFNGQTRFNMQKYVDGQLVDQQSNVGREVFTKVLADIPFTVSSERLNKKGDFEPFVDFGTGAMDYNTFALTHLLKSNNTYIKKQNGEPLIVNGKKVMFANPQFRIDVPYQDSQVKPDTVTTEDKKANIERKLGIKLPAKNTSVPVSPKTWGDKKSLANQISSELKGVFERGVSMQEWLDKGYGRQLATWADETVVEFLEVVYIEKRRQEEISKPLEAVKNAKTKEDLIKTSEEWIGVNPYDDGAVSMGVRSLLMTPGSFEKGKQAFIEENKKIAEIRNKQINTRYDAELLALENEEVKEEKPKVVHSISIAPIKNEDVKPAETISANDIKVIDKFFEQELGNKEKIFKGVDDRKKFLSEQLIRYRLGEQISNPMLRKVLSDLDELSKKLPTLNKVVQRGPVVKRDTAAAKSWFAEKLPFVNLEVVNGLIDNGVGESFGQFKDAVVYLSDMSNGEAHERHEAFHAVMHMYLTPKKRARIYLEAEGKFGKPTKEEIKAFRAENANTEQYSDAEISNFVLEEKMGDEFMSVEDTYLPNFIQRMFNAIKDFIRHILGKPAYMERLYQNIAGGKFTYKPLYSNATVTLNAIARPRNPYFTESQEAEIVNVLTGMLFETMNENPNLPLFSDENLTGYDTLLYNKIKNKVDEYRVKKAVENVTVFSDGYDSPQENWVRVKESYAQDGIYPGLFNRVIENLESKHNFKTKKGKIAFTDIEGLEKSYDTNFLSLNPDKTVSGLIKSKFMKMVSSEKSTLLDMPKYVDFKKTFPGYYRRLSDNHTTIDSKIDTLRELSQLISSDVNLGKSLDALIVELEQTSGVELLRTQFFQTFNNYSHPQMRTEVTKTEDGYVYQNMNVSSRNFRKELIEMWKQNYYSKMEQSLLEISENTEDKQIEYNKRKRGEYLQKLGRFRDVVEKAKSVKEIIDAVDNIVDVLDDIGVTLGSRETTKDAIIHYINDEEIREHASDLRKTSNDVEIVKFMLTSPKLPFTIPMFIGSGGIIESMKDGASPFAGETAGWWNNIGDLLSPFYIDKYDNIAFTIEGEKQWVINTPNQLAIFFSKLKDRATAQEELNRFSYLTHSNWLSNMVKDGQINMNNISKFDYSMHQGVVLGAEGIPYHKMNDIHRSLTSLSLFLDSYLTGSREHNRFWVNLPFEADKTRHYVLNVPYYRSTFENNKFIFNNTNPSFVAFLNTVKQEIQLVSNLRQQFIEQFGIHDWKSEIPIEKIEEVRKNNPQFLVEPLIVIKKNGKYFPGNGLKFTFITSLNELSSEELTEESKIQEVAKEYIKKSVDEFFTKIKNEGLVSSVEGETVSEIISLEMYRQSHEGNLSHMLVDFFVNYTIAQREIKAMLTGLDGEYKNVYDEGKRMAQYGAPVKTLYTEYINEQYGNLVMEDIEMELSSADKDIISKRLGTNKLDFLDGITRNDAQGYCTINRYIEILRGSGRMPQEGSAEYAALQRIIEGNATFDDYNTFMTQPIKGFYYKRMFNASLGRHLSYQVKYALVPLTKQFTEGTQLQKLKEKAEALETQSGVNIEIIPRSAFKVGTTNVISIHNDNFELDENKLNSIRPTDLVKLDNDAWGIQQDIPYHDLDYDQKLGTQIAKLILSNIDLQSSYVVGGIPMTGAQIIEEFSDATIENLNSDLREVVEKFVSDDNIRKMLEETIEEDEKAHNLKGLLETRNGEFLLPLAFNISAREFMPLLKAKFNKVRDLTMPGSPFIQVSDAFLKRNTTDKLPTGIQWIDGHDGNLKMHMEGNTIYAEVVVSPTSMKYVVDGELDINKIQKECPEALEMIGYRIPTSSKSYSMVLKVVGFANKAAFGDSIIVPPQLMKHMGFDFDVDKMFTLSKRFGLSDGTNVQNGEIVEKGKFFIYDSPDVKTGNRRYMNENRIFNVIKSIIQSPHHVNEVIASGEFDRLEKAANKYMLGIDTIDSNTYTGQRIMNERNMSAVTLKGIFANANGFLPIAQITNMSANAPYSVYIKKDGNSYVLNTFGKFNNEFTNLEGELISSVAGEFVTAIMDAAKKPTTSLINVNLFTASTAYTMVSMGIPINDMAVFMQQPIIRRAYKIFNDTDGYFKPKSPFFSPIKEAKEELLENLTGSTYGYNLLNKYLEQAAHIKSKKDGVDVPVFRYDEDINYEIDFNELENHYKNKPIGKIEKSEVVEWIAENYDYVVSQLKVINAYSNLSKLAANYTAANTALSSDRNNDSHLNSIHRMAETRVKLLGTEKVPPVILTRDKNGDLYPGVEAIFDEETSYPLGPAYWNIDESALDLLTRKSRFFFNNVEFRNKYNDMKEDLSIFAEKQVDEDIYAKYVNALMAYVNSQNDILNSIDREYYMSERFIKDFFNAAEVAIKNGFNVFSEFRVSHEAIDKLRNSGIALITFEPSDKLDDTMIDEYSGQLAAIEDSEFEASDEDRAIIEKLYRDLVNYVFITTGFIPTKGSINRILPYETLLHDKYGIAENIRSKFETIDANTFVNDDFVELFVKHNAMNNKIVYDITRNMHNTSYADFKGDMKESVISSSNKNIIRFNKKTGELQSVKKYIVIKKVETKNGKTYTVPKLYKFVGLKEKKGIWIQIETRGAYGKSFEYFGNKTAYPLNNPAVGEETVYNAVKQVKGFIPMNGLNFENFEEQTENQEDTNENDVSLPEVKGINISSRSDDVLGRALTNPIWGSKKDGKNYYDVETEYKKGQSKKTATTLNFEDALRYDMNLMYRLQVEKFKRNPELIDEITKRGGVAFLEASSHIVGVKGSRWEGQGLESNFIKVLIEAYKTASNQKETTEQPKGLQVAFKADELAWVNVKDKLKGKSITQKQWEQLTKEEQNKILECL